MENNRRPLVEALRLFKQARPTSFHVPGHKNGYLSNLPAEISGALQYDFTELTGLDDLHEPEGVIAEAQQKLSELYRSDQSFFLVNGSTVGNLAMVYATCREGDTVIVQRNAHKSIFHAIELTNARPVFVTPQWDDHSQTATFVTAQQINKAIKQYPNSKAVIVTYPTYYGTTGTELQEVIQLCHANGIPVLVDEAHGAHFVIGSPFPQSALQLGADVVVHSAHKTLPAMTMASFLHIKSKLVSPKKIAHALHMLQSSSPSYVLMASLDDARAYAESFQEEEVHYFIHCRTEFIQKLNQIPRLQTVETDDPLKLIVRMEGYSGFEIQQALETEGVYSELADPNQVLFVLPLVKEEHNFPFAEIVSKISRALSVLPELKSASEYIQLPNLKEDLTTLYYSPNELEQLTSEWVHYTEALGYIAAAPVTPYPPGIPLLLGGELITEKHIHSLTAQLQMGARIQGAIRMKEQQILVVKRRTEE